MKAVHYIDASQDWSEVVSLLSEENQIALDLEFDNNLHHYGFRLCLMQIASSREIYLIDPHKVDISLIFPVLEDNSIQKLVFSFGEDMRLLHALGCNATHLCDLSTAAKLLNYERFSLADVVHDLLDLSMKKDSQMSAWCKRPLTQEQLEYAAMDVLYLAELFSLFEKESREKDIYTWWMEENKDLETRYQDISIENQIPLKYQNTLDEVEWHVFQRLWNWREQLAKKWDKPAHHIFGNTLMVNLIQNPDLFNNWVNTKGLSHRVKTTAVKNELLQLVQQSFKEAKQQGFSKDKSARPKISREEYKKYKAEKMQRDILKEKILKPIQNQIITDYGEHAAYFILSSKQMDLWLQNKKDLAYRDSLIQHYLDALGLRDEWEANAN